MLPKSLENRLKEYISNCTGSPIRSLRTRPATGGSINQAATVFNEEMTLFVKWNDHARYPGMFEAEAKGLNLLKDHGAMVPQVLETGSADLWSYIVMASIERGDPSPASEEQFGNMLANLHQNSSSYFGLDHNNYMGSLPQHNNPHNTWDDFYINERLLPQLIEAINHGKLPTSETKKFDRLFQKLPNLIPAEPPSLVHGDLWSGNYLTDTQENTWLIDPAVAFGHREVDIAMTFLFGGFPSRFYDAYQARFPLEPDWESRLEIFQLYPLLVHVNLFGGGYTGAVQSIISRF